MPRRSATRTSKREFAAGLLGNCRPCHPRAILGPSSGPFGPILGGPSGADREPCPGPGDRPAPATSPPARAGLAARTTTGEERGQTGRGRAPGVASVPTVAAGYRPVRLSPVRSPRRSRHRPPVGTADTTGSARRDVALGRPAGGLSCPTCSGRERHGSRCTPGDHRAIAEQACDPIATMSSARPAGRGRAYSSARRSRRCGPSRRNRPSGRRAGSCEVRDRRRAYPSCPPWPVPPDHRERPRPPSLSGVDRVEPCGGSVARWSSTSVCSRSGRRTPAQFRRRGGVDAQSRRSGEVDRPGGEIATGHEPGAVPSGRYSARESQRARSDPAPSTAGRAARGPIQSLAPSPTPESGSRPGRARRPRDSASPTSLLRISHRVGSRRAGTRQAPSPFATGGSVATSRAVTPRAVTPRGVAPGRASRNRARSGEASRAHRPSARRGLHTFSFQSSSFQSISFQSSQDGAFPSAADPSGAARCDLAERLPIARPPDHLPDEFGRARDLSRGGTPEFPIGDAPPARPSVRSTRLRGRMGRLDRREPTRTVNAGSALRPDPRPRQMPEGDRPAPPDPPGRSGTASPRS